MITEMALESLRKLPLEVSLGSPVMVPIFYTKTNMSLKDSPTLLGTEMYLKTPGSDDEDRMKPNARLRVVMGNANLDGFVWVGFVPSLIWDDPSYSPGHEETVKILQHVLKTAIAITECDAFRRLNMMMLDQRISECVKFVGTGHYWTCYLDVKLRRFRLVGYCVIEVLHELTVCIYLQSNSTGNYKSTIFENDFRLKGVKSLRLLPFGLTAPFLDRQWRKLFPEHV